MEVITYLKILGKYWWLIVLAAVVSTGAAAGISLTKSKSYSAEALVVVRPATGVLTETNDLVNMMSELGTRSVLGTFAQLLTSADVQHKAQQAVGLSETSALDYPIQANVLPDTTVIEVSGKGHDPKLLADYINASIAAAVANGTSLFQVLELQSMQTANVPKDPTSPIPSRDIPIGGLLGLGLGILLALAVEYLRNPRKQEAPYDPRIRSLPTDNTQNYPALPTGFQNRNRDDMYVINGQSRQEYLGPGNQQNNNTGPLTDEQLEERNRSYLTPGRK